MERSVLVMLSDRSSAPTLLGCRPSARKSLGRFQKRFQLLKKIIFCSLHKENNHSFKANSLLNRLCPRRYVGRGPDTMIVVVGDVLHTCLDRTPEVPLQCLRLPQPPHESQQLQRSHHPSGLRVSAQKHQEHEHQGDNECALSANVAWTCRTD